MKNIKEFGAIPTRTRTDLRPEVDATLAFQVAADEGGVILVDDYFFVSGTIAITKPVQFILEGNPGHIYPGDRHGNNTITNPYQPLGCLYAGPNSRDMFHVFTSGFHLSGGLIDMRNCVYDGVKPYYVPPAVFRYCYWQNLIYSGSLDVEIAGNQTEAMKFNGGHIGVFFDGSRPDHPRDPKSYPNAFNEMHYCTFKVRGNFLYAPVFGNECEPYQDYSKVINHTMIGGCQNEAVQDGDFFYAGSPMTYVVSQRTNRRLTIRWGKSSIATVKLDYRSGSFVDLINQELKAAGLDSRFQAIPFTPAVNQSFILRSTESFSFRCYRPNTCNLHDIEIISAGCKTVHLGAPGDHSKIKARFQTFPMLAKSGNPNGVLDEELSEWDFPCYTVSGQRNQIDLQYVDLGKGNTDTRKANPVAIVNSGEFNEPLGATLTAVENRHCVEIIPFANSKLLSRNSYFFSQTNWTSSTGRDGFISEIDDCLAMADKRFEVVLSGSATVSNVQNLFRYTNFPLTTISYGAGFSDSDFVEIRINTLGQLEVVSLYLQLDSVNRPKVVELIAVGSSSTASRSFDMRTFKVNTLSIDGLSTNNTNAIVVRLCGVQDATKPVTIRRLAAKNRHPYQSCKPFLTTEGSQKVYGSLDIKDLRIDGRPIRPQPAGSATIQELEAKLKAAGILI